MKNLIEKLNVSNEQRRAVGKSKSVAIKLAKSLEIDKKMVDSHSVSSLSLEQAVIATESIYDHLGVTSEQADGMSDMESLILSKEGIVNLIKKMFKANKINLTESKYQEVVDYVDENIEDAGAVVLKSKYITDYIEWLSVVGYSDITTATELIDAIQGAKTLIDRYYSENDLDIFKFENMLDAKPLKKLGFKHDEKIRLYNNKTISAISNFKISEIIKKDKKNGINVDEYRILPLGFIENGYISVYILRYVKNKDLYMNLINWDDYKLNGVKKMNDGIVFNKETYLNMKDLYTNTDYGTIFNPASLFEEGYDENVVNKKLDTYLTTVSGLAYDSSVINNFLYKYTRGADFVNDWDLKFTGDINLVNYVVNVSLDNFYDNEEQDNYGNNDLGYSITRAIYYDLVYSVANKLVSK